MEDSNSTHDQLPQWHDPLLLTDVQQQQEEEDNTSSLSYSSNTEPISSKFQTLAMVDSNSNEDTSWQESQSVESITMKKLIDRVENDAVDGRSMLGFSLTSPDLVICAGSPDLSRNGYRDSPELLDGKFSIELSLENGIDGSDMKDSIKTPCVKFSSVFQTFNKELSPESSFELLPHQEKEEKLVKDLVPGMCINAGCTDRAVVLGGVEFLGDDCFLGGDTVRTDATIGDGQNGDLSLYQTARYEYLTFFIQEKKVVSCLDIYAQVGANRPLVVSDLKAFVEGDEGLLIRFEGVMGKPIVCGISVTKDFSANTGEARLLKPTGMSLAAECDSSKEENGHLEVEGDYQKLLKDHEFQRKELTDMRRAMDELKRENRFKSRECQDALKSLQELQNELMRKSMHVGSLAFAIEGQVKEKSRWFTSLRDLTRKLKIMKMEHIKLSEEVLAYKNCLVDMDEIRSTILSKMKQQVDLHEDLKIKFVEGAKERKELYNKVLELKGNIRVFCRCRPLKSEEVAAGASMTIDFESAKDGELTVMSNGLPKKTFKFDAVFGPRANQADVFEDTASFASSVLDGYNVCIFAYGQTGTGKTFTMEGTEDDRGVNFRTLEQLFRMIKEREKLFRYDVSVSVLEVYNEQIQDLLVSDSQPGVAAKRLEIRQAGEGLHHVPGLVEANVHNMSEVWEVLQTGSNARAVGSTNANEHSSRSHCIHCVMVKGENLLNGECTKSKLWLVDLAGSERIAKTEVQGERLKETQNINKSLSALGDVISALATKSPHIPFRNSKLTHLLQDSLGGDSKTLMFVQISPNENDLGETICSLNFASRVRGIELGPAKRQLDNAELLRYKQMAEKSKQDLKSKDVQIKKLEDTINGLDLKTKEKDFKYKILQDKVKELEAQLLVERKLARQHVDTKIAEQQQQQQMKQHQDEQIIAPPRPPLANRILGSKKNFDEPVNGGALNKEHINLTQPLKGNTSYKSTIPLPSTEGIVKLTDSSEKENNPVMADQPRFLKKTGRASICTTAKRVLAAPAPRRNSMIPLPSIPSSFPLCLEEDIKEDSEGSETNCLPEHTQCDSPREIRYGSKRISTMLKRSLQKKGNMKSPLQQHMRRGGINVGMEKVRVSIGSRGRIAHRVLLGNGRRTGMREAQQKQMPGEKERRWNSGTVARTPI
ncbi:hypothetical protein OIU76_025690 [Salix suchowensis]|nr:hypothetical protein OIU76_025690 [Salix suchowensis]